MFIIHGEATPMGIRFSSDIKPKPLTGKIIVLESKNEPSPIEKLQILATAKLFEKEVRSVRNEIL